MNPFWLTFTNYKSGCIEAANEDEAKLLAATFGEVKTCAILPYPADPRLHKHVDPKFGVCPSFCWTPASCAGRTACPRNPSCTE